MKPGADGNSVKPGADGNLRLHCWVPNLFEFQGGIQRYLQDLLRAIASQPHRQTTVFNKRDHTGDGDLDTLPNLDFRYFGAMPDALKTPVFAAGLAAAAWRDRPDLILCGHLHFAPVARALHRLTGIPYWIFVYGIDAWNVQNPLQQAALHAADKIIAIGHYTRDRLLAEQPLDPHKILLLPCMIDAQRFRPAPKPDYLLKRYGLQPDQPVVLTVARLVGGDSPSDPFGKRHKGYDAVLEALPQVRQAMPQVHYVLVGKGGDRPRLEARIAELGLQDGVTLAGFVPDAELCDHYNLCDVFAMPSRGEGFGIVYLEAIACGKPALGGNQDGATDALAQGELGALVDPTDIDAIAQSLIQLLQGTYPNPLLYQPAELRQRAIALYGRDAFTQTLNQLLQESDRG
ncbi:MAG: hypothetical protein Fur0046_40400 [Cyanobacteria bacterium J069]